MTLFATFGVVFWSHWVSFGPHPHILFVFMELNISLGPTISFLFPIFLVFFKKKIFLNFFFLFDTFMVV
jgi:hypothetical protein